MGVRDNIIAAAYDLFCSRGYDKTSVQQIVDASGSSKGGFYHHFETKDDVIEAIGVDILKSFDDKYKALAADNKSSIYDLVNKVMAYVFEYKVSIISEWPGIARMLTFDGSAKIKTLITVKFEEMTTQCYQKLFERGIKEEAFRIEYPKQLAGTFAREVIRVYRELTGLALDSSKQNYDDFVSLLEYLEKFINNQLGLQLYRIDVKKQALKYFENIKEKAEAMRKE